MVTVTIRGKKFPLCLTVAALDEVNIKCGGLNRMYAFLDGKDDSGSERTSAMICNTAWMLGLLIREGEENRRVNARFVGETVEKRVVPNEDDMAHYLNIQTVLHYRDAVIQAVKESMEQDIEAEYPKNGEGAGQG